MVTTDETWTVAKVLTWTTQHFTQKGIDSPRLDAELLLAGVLKKDRVYLYTHYDQPLTPQERACYRDLVYRRAGREPVAYILGEREFYGLSLRVTRDVLVPRPETEHLVDAVRDWLAVHPVAEPRLVDVGTGSGAIAVALAAQVPSAKVFAIDLSPQALAVARINVDTHELQSRVELLLGDLLAPVPAATVFDVIAANLPYIAEGERTRLMPEVIKFEPEMALFGGDDGLELIRRLIIDAGPRLAQPGLLALEIGAGQWPLVETALRASGYFAEVSAVADLQGHRRVALATRLVA